MAETRRQRYIGNIKLATMFKDQDTMIKISVKAAREICDFLEEQEQKYVPSIGGARDFGTVSSHWYRCGYPECGFPIDRGDIYCRHCGRLIAWEEPGKPEPPKEDSDAER